MDNSLVSQVKDIILFNFKQNLFITGENSEDILVHLTEALNQASYTTVSYNSREFQPNQKVESLHQFFSPFENTEGKKALILHNLDQIAQEDQMTLVNRIRKDPDVKLFITGKHIENINYFLTNSGVHIEYNTPKVAPSATVIPFGRKNK